MYLPKNEYRIRQALPGEFIRPNGEEYTGKYIETSSGTFYEGDSLEGTLSVITPAPSTEPINIPRPFNDYLGPTDRDYEKGFFTRYFTRDIRNGKFTELGLKQWREKRSLNYVTAGEFNWIITGPLNDGFINNIPFKGVSTKNKETLQLLEKEYPGISNFFSNTLEFVR